MKLINAKQEFLNYIFILIGSFSLAFGVVGFLAPNKIATGGTAGLAIVFHYLTDLPTGTLLALINIPLLAVSVKYLGKYFALKTIVTIILMGAFIDLLAEVIHLPMLSDEPLLATLYGGVIIGIGLGLIFKGGASAGGGTIIAKIITSKTSMKTGNVILILDASKAARSVAATALGFKKFHRNSRIEGLILNNLGSKKHENLCRQALASLKIPILGTIPKNPQYTLQSRHLGLIPILEGPTYQKLIEKISRAMSDYLEIDKYY